MTLHVNALSKNIGGEQILNAISFEVQEKECVAIVGINGSGKSTLFRLLNGHDVPDSGAIHWKKGTTIGTIEQLPDEGIRIGKQVLDEAFESANDLEATLQELENRLQHESNEQKLMQLAERYTDCQEAFSQAGGYERDTNIRRVAKGLGITHLLEQPFSSMSGGEKTKLALGKVLLQKPAVLLLDEPTNHLDIHAMEWLTEYVRSVDATVLFISHDRQFLSDTAERVIELEDGEAVTYEAGFERYEKLKEERLLAEFKNYQEQQKKIKKMKETIKQLRIWANQANPPNDSMHRRAGSMEKALNRMEKVKRPTMHRRQMNVQMDVKHRSGTDAIVAENVRKQVGDKALFHSLSFTIYYQDRIAIVGRNGSGKTTLLRLLLEEIKPDEGRIQLGSQVDVGYVSQHLFTDEKRTVLETFRDHVHVDEGEARRLLATFLFYGNSVWKKVSQLSGGERVRLRLAQFIHQNVNLLILDEPTNHLDLASQEVLEEALSTYAGTIVLVSHDRYLIDRLAEGVYWLENGTMTFTDGGYTRAKQKQLETHGAL
ncbi:ribosomal protection-like ABC-F family protein [Bacillus daqingensis]|uniref:Ribosomal protection-like ABC-F family protein n=1 Tax=Bacillus daqingensis TaxID=872396 RepID=A0ABV9NWU3_9BACI